MSGYLETSRPGRGTADRRRRLPRLAVGVRARMGMARRRPHQRPDRRRHLRHRGLGPRLRRRVPAQGHRVRRRSSHSEPAVDVTEGAGVCRFRRQPSAVPTAVDCYVSRSSLLVLLITGAARAIGAATAAELSAAGHQVIATARDTTLLDELDVADRLPLDVTDEESIRSTLERAGELDAIVNNAGGLGEGPPGELPGRAAAGHVRDQHHRAAAPAPRGVARLEEPRERRGGQRELGAGSGGHPARGSVLGDPSRRSSHCPRPCTTSSGTSGSGS